MNSIHQHFIFEYMFVILYTFTKITTICAAFCCLGHIYIYISYVTIIYNIIHSSSISFALLLLALIILHNTHAYPCLVLSLLNSTSILYSTFVPNPTQHLQFCDVAFNTNSVSLTLYQNGKFVSVIPLSYLY